MDHNVIIVQFLKISKLKEQCAFDGPHTRKDRSSDGVFEEVERPDRDLPIFFVRVRAVDGGKARKVYRNQCLPVDTYNKGLRWSDGKSM